MTTTADHGAWAAKALGNDDYESPPMRRILRETIKKDRVEEAP
jgi:hypothetical protein